MEYGSHRSSPCSNGSVRSPFPRLDYPQFNDGAATGAIVDDRVQNLEAALFKLRQTGSLMAYLAEFHRLASCSPTVGPKLLLRCFVWGLKSSLRYEMLSHPPPETVDDAITLAIYIDSQFVAPECTKQIAHQVFDKMSNSNGGCHDLRAHSQLTNDGVMMNVTTAGEKWENPKDLDDGFAAPQVRQPISHGEVFNEFPYSGGGVQSASEIGYHPKIADKGGGCNDLEDFGVNSNGFGHFLCSEIGDYGAPGAKLSEGFTRITCCQNESDVQSAVDAYSGLGPLDTLPTGCFGQVQLGIMKFLKKTDAPANTEPTKRVADSNASQITEEEDTCLKGKGAMTGSDYNIAMHPEKLRDAVLKISDDVVVQNDMYPKAKRHLLVVAQYEGLNRLAVVREEHLQLLKTMHAVGLKWAEKLLHDNSSLVFRLGYHSEPSMRQLHLHVISQDFDSTHLKNKKHWNSLNTAFFRDSVDVLEEVSTDGKAVLKDDDSLISMELRCRRCRSAHPNIPRLKSHITKSRAPFPNTLLQNGQLVLAPSNVNVEVAAALHMAVRDKGGDSNSA